MRLTTSPPSCVECHEIWEPKLPGTLWVTPGLLRDSFTDQTYDYPQDNLMYANKHTTNVVTNYCLPAPTNKPDDCAHLQYYVRNVH